MKILEYSRKRDIKDQLYILYSEVIRQQLMIDSLYLQIHVLPFLLALGLAVYAGTRLDKKHKKCQSQQIFSFAIQPQLPRIQSSSKFLQIYPQYSLKFSQNQKEKPVIVQDQAFCQSRDNLDIQVADPLCKKTIKDTQSDKQSLSCQFLSQKVSFQMKKMQSTGFFQMRLESSSDNKFIRKIQKHQLITDYDLGAVNNAEQSINLFQNKPINTLFESQSLLNVVAHQNHHMQLYSPLCEQKFITPQLLSKEWRQGTIASWLLQNGKFKKLFRGAKLLGKGGFGSVFGVCSILDQKQYAVKKLVVQGQLQMGELMNEAVTLGRQGHPNVVQYYNVWIQLATLDQALQYSSCVVRNQTNSQSKHKQNSIAYVQSGSGFTFQKSEKKSSKAQSNKIIALAKPKQEMNVVHLYTLHIQMQLCETTLHSYLRSGTHISHIQAFMFFQQLLQGVAFLHNSNIVHRDLKPGNILLYPAKKLLKIGDFGLATLIDEQNNVKNRGKVGTPLYMAPQLCFNSSIDKAKLFLVDVFSVAVIYFQMLSNLHDCTQHQRSEKMAALQENKVLLSKELKQEKKVIKIMTKINKRPSTSEIKESKEYLDLKNKYKS